MTGQLHVTGFLVLALVALEVIQACRRALRHHRERQCWRHHDVAISALVVLFRPSMVEHDRCRMDQLTRTIVAHQLPTSPDGAVDAAPGRLPAGDAQAPTLVPPRPAGSQPAGVQPLRRGGPQLRSDAVNWPSASDRVQPRVRVYLRDIHEAPRG